MKAAALAIVAALVCVHSHWARAAGRTVPDTMMAMGRSTPAARLARIAARERGSSCAASAIGSKPPFAPSGRTNPLTSQAMLSGLLK